MNYDSFKGLFNMTASQGNDVYCQVLYAQALHETGNFTSSLYVNHKNMFGMRPAQQRERFYTGTVETAEGNFAEYGTSSQSLIDRVDLDQYNGVVVPQRVSEVTGYMRTVLSKGYATDPNYLTKWIATLKNVGEQIGGSDDEGEFDNVEAPSSMKWVYIVLFLVGAYFGYKAYMKWKSKTSLS